MTSPENHIDHQPALPDASAAGDWLRLTVMLLLLVIGRLVNPLHKPPEPLSNTEANKPVVHTTGFILTSSKR